MEIGGDHGKMKEYKVILGDGEIEILLDWWNNRDLDSFTIEDAILKGIIRQIQVQELEKK